MPDLHSRRQFDVEVVTRINGESAVLESDRDDVAAEFAVVGQEVQMVSRYLDPRSGVGESESNDGSRGSLHSPFRLVGDDLAQWFVGLRLSFDTAKDEISEDAVNADRDDRGILRSKCVEGLMQLIEIEG